MASYAFASDNTAGVHPKVLRAIEEASAGYSPAYGGDAWTQKAESLLAAEFGPDSQSFFVLTGTAANVLSISSSLRSHEAVVCADTAHLNTDECGAPERWCGIKLLPVPHQDGKLTVESLKASPYFFSKAVPHQVVPKIISITQSTELGAVYQPNEIAAIAEFAHAKGCLLHIDGARLCNAAVSTGGSLRSITRDVGADLVSFGLTKNGALAAEAIITFSSAASELLPWLRKQSMQLTSKHRFLSAQFIAMLENELWKENAAHANAMAKQLEARLKGKRGVRLRSAVEANALFVFFDDLSQMQAVQSHYAFYVVDEVNRLGRLMTSFQTTEADLRGLGDKIDGMANTD